MPHTPHSAYHAHHITPQKTLFLTGGMLLFLMALTIAAAEGMPEPFRSNTVLMNMIAVTIAIAKATLVISIFMGVKWASNLTKILCIGGFIWFLTMFSTMIDYVSRPYEPIPGWEHGQSSAFPRSAADSRE